MNHERLFLLSAMVFLQLGATAVGQSRSGTQGKPNISPTLSAEESGSGDKYYCRVASMPVAWRTEGQPVEIVHSDVVFTGLGTTTPVLEVRNTQAAAIMNLAVVLEYVDAEGRTVVTATAAGAVAGFEKTVPTPFPVTQVRTWKQPLDVNQTERIDGFSNGPATNSCPVSGRITFATIRYKGGVVRQYTSTGWQFPPLPRLVPRLESACPMVKGDVVEISAKLRINSGGDVVGVSTASLAHSEAFTWAAGHLKDWKFHPALVEGKPKESELNVELLFYSSSEQNMAAITPASPAVLIRFVPTGDASAPRCFEAFAFLSEESSVP